MTFVSFLFMTLVFIALICFPKAFNLSELSLPPTLTAITHLENGI